MSAEDREQTAVDRVAREGGTLAGIDGLVVVEADGTDGPQPHEGGGRQYSGHDQPGTCVGPYSGGSSVAQLPSHGTDIGKAVGQSLGTQGVNRGRFGADREGATVNRERWTRGRPDGARRGCEGVSTPTRRWNTARCRKT